MGVMLYLWILYLLIIRFLVDRKNSTGWYLKKGDLACLRETSMLIPKRTFNPFFRIRVFPDFFIRENLSRTCAMWIDKAG